MKNRCLLIAPPEEMNVFPRGIVEIASFLNQNEIQTAVLPLVYHLPQCTDTDSYGNPLVDPDESELEAILADAIHASKPDVIGISNVCTKDASNCTKIARICKQLRPDALIVMGGHHATFCDTETLRCRAVDVVVRGEGEWVMLNLMQALSNGKDYRHIRGLSFRADGNVRRNPAQPAGCLDKVPPVDFKLLPEEFVGTAIIHGILTRGCAYQCKYCVEKIYWGNPRRYPLAKQIAEMEILQREYGTQLAGLEESMLDMRTKRFHDYCRQIRTRRIDLPEQFYITTRIDAVTADGVKRLSSAGIGIVCVGIESFSKKVLTMMNKKQSPDTIRRGCEILKKHGIWTNAYWLIGHPGDSPHEAESTYIQFKRFFEKGLLQSGHAFGFVPYPGTRYYSNPGNYGIIIGDFDWNRWRRWTESPVSWLDNFSAEDINRACQKAWKLLKNYRTMNTCIRRAGLGGRLKEISNSADVYTGAAA